MNPDFWAEEARLRAEGRVEGGDRLLLLHLQEFVREWEFSASRSVRPGAWASLRAALEKGERDERVLLTLITPYGPSGEEVLRVIQAIEAYQWLSKWGGGSDRDRPRGESWWVTGGFLPHLGGPFHQDVWGNVRSACSEGRFNKAYWWCRHPRLSRLPTSLAADWQSEVQDRLLPYIFQVKRRAPFVPRLPPGLKGGHCVAEADAHFLGVFYRKLEEPDSWEDWEGCVRASMWGHLRAMVAVAATLTPLQEARAFWRGPRGNSRQSYEVQYRPQNPGPVRSFLLEGVTDGRDAYTKLLPLDLSSKSQAAPFFPDEGDGLTFHLEDVEKAAKLMEDFWDGFLSREILRRWG
jgi:hypothetical protein